MDNIAFGELAAALQPRTDDPIILILDILLYLCFFLNLAAFFMQSDKQILATMLVGLSMLLVLVGKLSTFWAEKRGGNPIEYLDENHLTMLIVNVGIFVIPIIVTGMSKAKKSKPITIIAGVLGGFYFFAFWFFLQLN